MTTPDGAHWTRHRAATRSWRLARACLPLLAAAAVSAVQAEPWVYWLGDPEPAHEVLRSKVLAADGGQVAFTTTGEGETALVFVHCGLCDQEVWREQVEPLAELGFRVVTLDLTGHGESGKTRTLWTLDAFANDVRAVTERLGLDRYVLVGNSLGASVALAAAARDPKQVLGVVAVDSLHDAGRRWANAELQAYIDTFRDDYAAACRRMVDGLLHEDAKPALRRWIHGKMCAAGPELTANVIGVFFGYETDEAMAAAGVPIRAINGDRQPTAVESNRRVAPGFEARIIEGVGHFPQLEAPELFNRYLVGFVKELQARGAPSSGGGD